MSQRKFKLKLKLNVYILSAATIIYCLAIGYISYQLKEISYADSLEIVKGTTREHRNKISEELNVMMQSARTMRNIFDNYQKYEPAQRNAFFEQILRSNLEKNPDFLSLGVYWELKALDKSYKKKNGRFWDGYFREGNKIINQKAIEDTTNQELTSTYYQIRRMNKETIVNPYYDQSTKELKGILMTSLLSPIQNGNGQFVGMVGIDISLSHMNQLISSVKPYQEAVSYIVSENKTIVAHTNVALTGKNFFETLAADSTWFKNKAFDIAGTKQSFLYQNSSNGEEYLVCIEPISIGNTLTDWVIGVEVPTKIILAESKRILFTAIFVGILGLILMYVVIYFIAERISEPILKSVDFAKLIASGNLHAKLSIPQKDEIGDLADSLSQMAFRLTTIMTEIIQSSDTISESSLELLESSVRFSEGANNQAASSEEISTTMDQMLLKIQQNNFNAEETAKIAMKAATGIQDGNAATQTLILSMNNIAQKISVIGEIARQTNLLAINAAIEASRYGTQGKSFGVVAAEIKKLAERSQLAAKEINDLSNYGLLQARETGEKLVNIIPEIELTAHLVKQISESSNEQRLSSIEINQGVQQLNRVTQQNAESSFKLSLNSKKISEQAENLKKLIAFFRIEE